MATDAQTSRTVAETFLAHLAKQDADGIQELFAESIDWLVSGTDALSWTGRRTRREEVAPYFTTMWPHFVPGRSNVVLERFIVDGGDVVLLAVFTHTVVDTGKEFTTPVALHLGVEDGQVVRMHLYEDTLTVAKAFNVS
ncbi:nuclear transport factor 2 family protein [Kineosporia babensis]|uniref:Nuclear transport factor 2 family protein n=1 Tax=Kineosporia babensis TaxID=499548 RepID=A0A9X1NH37_9ACTN|nr:nuclear transport factor 2 family protein [Kineosporia babensis]MCD5314033.1 nuclear transport factor 2 family protein [Kineosporia babensis]